MGVICGSREVMENFSPTGSVYQAGTLSGNPLSVAAGIALLTELRDRADEIYPALEAKGQQLQEGWQQALDRHGIAHCWNRAGSMFGLFFTEGPVNNFSDASGADEQLFRRFFHGMLAAGVAIAPSPYEAGFLSMAHSAQDIDHTTTVIENLSL